VPGRGANIGRTTEPGRRAAGLLITPALVPARVARSHSQQLLASSARHNTTSGQAPPLCTKWFMYHMVRSLVRTSQARERQALTAGWAPRWGALARVAEPATTIAGACRADREGTWFWIW